MVEHHAGNRADGEQRPSDLLCNADRLAFPIRDGIPDMLESEAQPLDGELQAGSERLGAE